MKKIFFILIIVLIIATLGISAFFSNDDPKTTKKLINNSKINTTNYLETKENLSVVAILEGPKSVKENEDIKITWKITNNLNVPITNVFGSDQNENHDFGQINPGETKIYSFSIFVPSLFDIKDDFGLNETISEPFYIGGFNVKYFVNGIEKSITSNSIEIELASD